jgi:hypothetical protein
MQRPVEAEAGPVALGPGDPRRPAFEARKLEPDPGADLAMAGDLEAAAVGRQIDHDHRRARPVVGGSEARADADRVTHEAPAVLGGCPLEPGGDSHWRIPFVGAKAEVSSVKVNDWLSAGRPRSAPGALVFLGTMRLGEDVRPGTRLHRHSAWAGAAQAQLLSRKDGRAEKGAGPAECHAAWRAVAMAATAPFFGSDEDPDEDRSAAVPSAAPSGSPRRALHIRRSDNCSRP